jgi:hypothetical protein
MLEAVYQAIATVVNVDQRELRPYLHANLVCGRLQWAEVVIQLERELQVNIPTTSGWEMWGWPLADIAAYLEAAVGKAHVYGAA